MKAQNSLSSILAGINLSQNNILKIAQGYLVALTSSSNSINVEIENSDGTVSQINIPTNIFINNELQRLTASFRNVVGLSEDGKARLISENGDFREILVSSYLPSIRPEDHNMSISTNIDISTNNVIENLISPLTEVEIILDKEFSNASSVYVTKILTSDLSGLTNGMTFGEVKIHLTSNLRELEILNYQKEIAPRKSRFYGEFLVDSHRVKDQLIEVRLNQITYSDEENLFENTKSLQIGDTLVNQDGSSMYTVEYVSRELNLVKLKHVSGVGRISDKLIFKDQSINVTSVKVPVRINEKSIIFLEIVDKHTNQASPISTAKVFDSDNYIVNDNGVNVTFNEYFSTKVADIGKHIESLVRENSIPAVFGEKPQKPTITSSDLNVLQINKHLTNTANTDKIRASQREKDQLFNQIAVLNSNIADLNAKLTDGNYVNQAKLSSDKTQLAEYIKDKNQKSELLDSITKDIKSMLDDSAEISISPKYRVRGFWDVPLPLPSNITNPQHIVQYDVRYRYVSNTGNTSNTSEMIYKSGENQVNAIFSSWNLHKTGPLEKVVGQDGEISWVENNPTDVNSTPINNLDIPISYGESVELQIRAVSEAGWPNSPIKSDWSDVTRVDFPVELLQETDLSTIAKRNNADLLKVQVMQEFATQGITEHLATSFKENDRLYTHRLRDIASGKLTSEQKQIDAETYIEILENRLKSIEETVNRRYAQISVQVLDEDLNEHDVTNNGTINLFAGNYLDYVDMADSSNFGTIISKKFYIKIVNRNAQTVEILSLDPGVSNQNTMSSKYNSVPLYTSSNNMSINQKKAQIFYSRNKNIDFTEDIYSLDTEEMVSSVNTGDINYGVQYESLKNVVNLNGQNVELVALNNNASLSGYVSMTNTHPAYKQYVSTNDKESLIEEYKRLINFNSLYNANGVQNATKDNLIVKFADSDKHIVGRTTCGSTLYIAINDIQSYQVEGIDTASAKEINSGESDSLLIPVEFQYRMSDALGNPNGVSGTSINSNFSYSKKIGIDLLINNKLFSFDINVSCRFRSTSVTNNSISNGTSSEFQPTIII